MKMFFLFIGLLMNLQYACALQIKWASIDTLEYTSETFRFTDAQRKQVLEGTLTIPKTFTVNKGGRTCGTSFAYTT